MVDRLQICRHDPSCAANRRTSSLGTAIQVNLPSTSNVGRGHEGWSFVSRNVRTRCGRLSLRHSQRLRGAANHIPSHTYVATAPRRVVLQVTSASGVRRPGTYTHLGSRSLALGPSADTSAATQSESMRNQKFYVVVPRSMNPWELAEMYRTPMSQATRRVSTFLSSEKQSSCILARCSSVTR